MPGLFAAAPATLKYSSPSGCSESRQKVSLDPEFAGPAFVWLRGSISDRGPSERPGRQRRCHGKSGRGERSTGGVRPTLLIPLQSLDQSPGVDFQTFSQAEKTLQAQIPYPRSTSDTNVKWSSIRSAKAI